MKKLNNIKRNKIILGISLLMGGTLAQAQWATFDVTKVLYDWFQSQRDQAISTNIEAVQAGQQVQIAQAAQNVVNTDLRNRIAMGMASIAKKDDETRPTLQLCIQASAKEAHAQIANASLGATGSPAGGGGSGGGRAKGAAAKPQDYNPLNRNNIQSNIQNEANAQAALITNINSLGACSARYGATLGCAGAKQNFALADVSLYGLLANSNTDQVMPGQSIANYSMDAAAQAVAAQYVTVATLANAPKLPSPTDLAKNPGYIALYNSIITKLNAAGDTLTDIAGLRIGGVLSGNALSLWSQKQGDYAITFANKLRFPTAPSLYEMINFTVQNDLIGPASVTNAALKGDELMQDVDKKLAFANYISWKAYSQQEKTNILLSHMLVQMATPIAKERIDAEFSKTVN